MISSKKLLKEKSIDQLSDSMDKILDLPESKTLTKDEQKEILSSVASLSHTLGKTSKSGIIPASFKAISRNFEKAGYDINKMPKEYAESFKRTYDDLSVVVKENPGYFKNKASKAYCDAYELMTGAKFKTFVNKMKSSKTVKNAMKSTESLNNDPLSMENLQIAISDLCRDTNVESKEFLGEGLLTKVLTPVAGEFTSLTSSIGTLSVVVIVAVIVISILIVCICLVSSMYQQRVVEAIEAICENKDRANASTTINKFEIAKAMEDKIPPATNIYLIKPMTLTTKYMNKLTEPKQFAKFSKSLDEADKVDNSKENLNQSEESAIGVASVIATTASVHPIIIGASIVAGLIMIIPMIRSASYWLRHFTFDLSNLLKDQNELIENNVEVLIVKRNDPNTPQTEKDRLDRIIERQSNIAKMLLNLSDKFYKNELAANTEAEYELKQDDNVDFENIVVTNDPEQNTTINNAPASIIF